MDTATKEESATYGWAEDIRGLLTALTSSNPDERARAQEMIETGAFHQGAFGEGFCFELCPRDVEARLNPCITEALNLVKGAQVRARHSRDRRVGKREGIAKRSEFGAAHAELFGEHHPATTKVEVSRLTEPEMVS